jgi:excisionase family DNA binding protein
MSKGQPNIKEIADAEKHGGGCLLTPKQAARKLSMSIAWIYAKHHKGDLPFPCVKVGSSLRFREEDIDAFIQQQINNQQRPYLRQVDRRRCLF